MDEAALAAARGLANPPETTPALWPDRALSPALAADLGTLAASPPDGAKVRQLAALARCLRDAIDIDVPLAAVTDLFGVDARAPADLAKLLDLAAPPPDDAAAFGDVAERTLRDAASNPASADALRRSVTSENSKLLLAELGDLDGGADAFHDASDFAFDPGRDTPDLPDAAGGITCLFDFKPKADDAPPPPAPAAGDGGVTCLFDFKPKADPPPAPTDEEDDDW